MKLAEFKNVEFSYDGQSEPLLRGVNLTLGTGEVVGIQGSNGCGKSSLIGLLTGRLQPDSGDVFIFGSTPCECHRLQGVGLVTEPFHPLQSPLPVEFSINQLLKWMLRFEDCTKADYEEATENLKISSKLLNSPIISLSKGERQRALLVLSLARRPSLLLLDEPLEGIDHTSRSIILDCIISFCNEDHTRSILWISHDMRMLASSLTRRLQLVDGQLLEVNETKIKASVQHNDDQDTVRSTRELFAKIEDWISHEDNTPLKVEIEKDGTRE